MPVMKIRRTLTVVTEHEISPEDYGLSPNATIEDVDKMFKSSYQDDPFMVFDELVNTADFKDEIKTELIKD